MEGCPKAIVDGAEVCMLPPQEVAEAGINWFIAAPLLAVLAGAVVVMWRIGLIGTRRTN